MCFELLFTITLQHISWNNFFQVGHWLTQPCYIFFNIIFWNIYSQISILLEKWRIFIFVYIAICNLYSSLWLAHSLVWTKFIGFFTRNKPVFSALINTNSSKCLPCKRKVERVRIDFRENTQSQHQYNFTTTACDAEIRKAPDSLCRGYL